MMSKGTTHHEHDPMLRRLGNRTTFVKSVLACLLCTSPMTAAEVAENDGAPVPSAIWLGTQLIASPELALGEASTHFGLRWQVTPLLYSWGVHRRVSGWRALVIEPFVRNSGSIELYLSPELIFADPTRILLRPGLRVYLPIVEHGDVLSVSLGTSYQRVDETNALALEVGAYILFGILGLQLSHAPGPNTSAQTIATLRIRYF